MAIALSQSHPLFYCSLNPGYPNKAVLEPRVSPGFAIVFESLLGQPGVMHLTNLVLLTFLFLMIQVRNNLICYLTLFMHFEILKNALCEKNL